MTTKSIKHIKKLTGLIVSDKMDKTCAVLIDEKLSHPMYGKIYHKSAKIKAHDENNEYKIGDMVEIAESRPFAKSKAWIVVRKIK